MLKFGNMTAFTHARNLVSSAGLVIWVAAWLGQHMGLGHAAYTVAIVAGGVLLLVSAGASFGVWLYGRARGAVRKRQYRLLGTGNGQPADGSELLAASAIAVTGSVGCAAVLVLGGAAPGDVRVAHSAAGRSGRPGQAITPDTRFEIGSVTKVFTGLILADMVLRGETDLDATLEALLGLPGSDGGTVTLRSLATHTSGMPRLVPSRRTRARILTAHPDPYRGIGLADAMTALARNPPSQPGSFRYSNLGYQLLGAALAAVAGTTWANLVQQRICQPLGMTHTSTEPDGHSARGHDRAGLPVPNWDSTLLPAAGALWSSTADLEKFLRAQLAPDATELGPAIRLSRAPQTGNLAVRRQGLGWMLETTGDTTVAWHNGGTGGFGAILAVADRPYGPAGAAILVNSAHDGALDNLARHMLAKRP
jgi:D-alanyl-D-alanine-carboxypeptidase/D-alanyl-D-alanine-endopeptidase